MTKHVRAHTEWRKLFAALTDAGVAIGGELEAVHTLTSESPGMIITDGVSTTDPWGLGTFINI